MTISHHLDHATLLAYSAGTLPAGLSLLVRSHLEMCSFCRKATITADEIGGGIMDSREEVEVSAASKNAVMEKIQTATLHRLPVTRSLGDSEVPRVLQEVIGTDDLDSLKWKPAGPGVSMYKLPRNDDENGFIGLLRIAPGHKLPDHGHGGSELTLILRGAYSDAIGQFGPGDMADLDESIAHTPLVSSDEECICLTANDAPTRFRSWSARLAQRFIGI